MSPNSKSEDNNLKMDIDLSKYIRKKTPEEMLDENNNVEDFTNHPQITTKCIKDYFNNCNIFVTGATGFLGRSGRRREAF